MRRVVSVFYSSRRQISGVASKLSYSEFGDPLVVIRKETEPLLEPKQNEVLIKTLASPVNPVDINVIQGRYPILAPLPATGGNEGVGEVLQTGPGVTDFSVGDRVVLNFPPSGTWRSHATLHTDTVFKVPKTLGIVEGATFLVNPSAAYRMLKDFVDLKPGDTVIQNGANSACGQNIIQLCSAWGLNSVNVVRDRPNLEELKSFLSKLGASHILTEGEVKTSKLFKNVKKPKLALNCVGGESASNILRHLDQGGVMVTYGGMSLKPIPVSTPALVFKDNKLVGHSNSLWFMKASRSEKVKMVNELADLMIGGKLTAPLHKLVRFDDYKEALENTLNSKGMVGKKYVITFDM